MSKEKLFVLLRSLSKSELKAFKAFSNNRFENAKTTLKVFSHVYKFRPLFKNKKLSKGYIEEKVLELPSSTSGKRISNEFSDLTVCLEEFLMLNKLNDPNNSYFKDRLLIEIYKERQLDNLLQKKVGLTIRKLDKMPFDIWDYEKRMGLNHILYYYHSASEKITKDIGLIQKTSHNLDRFYVLSKLKYACELENRSNVLTETVAETKETAPEQLSKEMDPLYRLYSTMHQLNREGTAKDFIVLKKILTCQSETLHYEDRFILWNYLSNFVANYMKTGHLRWYQEAFELHQMGVQARMIISGNHLIDSIFMNIVNVACELGKIDTAEEFVRSHGKFLKEETKISALFIARATIAFSKDKFDEALLLLTRVAFKDESYSLRTKLLQAKCYYELKDKSKHDYIGPLQSHIDSFQVFLHRNKNMNPNTIKSLQNFLRILKLLLNKSLGWTPNQLLSKLQAMELVVFRSWLEKKIRNCQTAIPL